MLAKWRNTIAIAALCLAPVAKLTWLYLRRLLEDPQGTGADRQIVVYQQTGSIDAVIKLLVQQTMQDISVDACKFNISFAAAAKLALVFSMAKPILRFRGR